MPTLTWLGHATFMLENGAHSLIIDPFLADNPVAQVKPDDVKAGFVVLTHGHDDHIADAAPIATANGATVIATLELALHMQSLGCTVHSQHIGGAHDFPFGRVKFVQAVHGSAWTGPNGTLVADGGMPAGVLITLGGKTVYHAGDTGLFGDMKLIGERHSIDVAILPIGDNFTMGPDDALYAAELIGAPIVIPCHYNTFELIEQDGKAFASAVSEKGMKGLALDVGESLEF